MSRHTRDTKRQQEERLIHSCLQTGKLQDTWDEELWRKQVGIFRSYLGPPNESEWDLGNLKWGRSTYEEITRCPPSKNPANEKYYVKTEFNHWRLRTDWKLLLPRPDPRALIPLHVDPTYEWCREDGGVYRQEYKLWDPQKLMNTFTPPHPDKSNPQAPNDVLNNIVRVINQPGMADTRVLSKAVNIHFRTIYLPQAEAEWKRPREADGGQQWAKSFDDSIHWEQHKQKVLKYWEDSVTLVAGCLLHHFQVWGEVWFEALFECEAVEELYFDIKDRRDAEALRLKTGGLTFTFPD